MGPSGWSKSTYLDHTAPWEQSDEGLHCLPLCQYSANFKRRNRLIQILNTFSNSIFKGVLRFSVITILRTGQNFKVLW